MGTPSRQDAEGIDIETVSATLPKETWKKLLGLVSEGVSKKDYLKKLKITEHAYQKHLRAYPNALNEIRQAKQAWTRKEWPYELAEEILTYIADGHTMTEVEEKFILSKTEVQQFYTLCMGDPEYRELYDNARTMQAETYMDQMVDIVNDETVGLTNSKVAHAKLKVETLRWNMAKLNPKRFGEKITQDVNQNITVDHASKLHQAHKRVKQAHKDRKKTPAQHIPKTPEIPKNVKPH